MNNRQLTNDDVDADTVRSELRREGVAIRSRQGGTDHNIP
jgi:hypothetical protein